MPGKRYSAGAIFLQVVPVFANVQRAIQDEAKGWDRTLGDEMEKSGARAGERAGRAASQKMRDEFDKGTKDFSGNFEREFHKNIDDINKALGGIDTKRLSNDLRRELSQVKKELAGLKDVNITADADFKRAYAAIAELEGRVRGLRDGAKIVFRSDIDQALRGFAKMEAAKEAISDPVEIKVKADTSQAERAMTSFEQAFKKSSDKAAQHLSGSMHKEIQRIKDDLIGLRNLRIGVDISANQARREITELMAELEALSHSDPNIDVKVDAARALAELATFEAALKKIDGQDVNVDIKTDRASRSLLGLAGSGDTAANTFRSFNVILLAVATLGPALVPVLAGITGGLLALGPAAAVAGAGLGAVLIGFSGLGNALTALQARQDQQAKNSQTQAKQNRQAANAIKDAQRGIRDAVRSAAQANADAQRSVADAERNAARAAEDAARRVVDARRQSAAAIQSALQQQQQAQQSYRDSVREVQQAEADLQQARRDAAGQGKDLANQIAENQLAMQQGLLDEFNSKVAYDSARADGSSTNAEIEQARINWEQAKLRQTELRQQQKQLAAEKKKWDKQGVEGTDAVQSAEDRLRSALEQQRNAYQQLRDAAQAVDKARADGARNVQQAIEDQNRTLADNKRAVENAKRAQARAFADGERGIARARQSLARARQSQDQLNTAINSQDQAVQAAFSKLGPAGRRFALFLFGLRNQFYSFRDDIQQAMLPSIQSAIEGFLGSGNFRIVRGALVALAGAFGKFVKALGASFQGKAWGDFFKMLRDAGPTIERVYGHAFIKFLEAMASILTTLAPFAIVFAKAIAGLAEGFARWARSQQARDLFTKFLGYVRKIGPDVWRFFVDLTRAVVALAVALAPWGKQVLDVLDKFLRFLAEMDPKTLGAIATAIVVLLGAAQVAYMVASTVIALTTLLSSPVGLIVFAIVGLAAVVAYLYNQNKEFHAFVTKAWKEISAAISDSWKRYIKPALGDMIDALNTLWKEVLAPFFRWLGPIIVWAAKTLIPILAAAFSVQLRASAFIIKHILVPVLQFMGKIFTWLWKDVVKPVSKAMGQEFTEFVNAVKWAYNHTLGPVFKAIGAAAKFLWQNALKPVFKEMGTNWHDVLNGMDWVWKHVLKPVWDFIANRALPSLESAFQKAVRNIGTIWDKLKNLAAAPVRFVIDTVLNHGLIAAFNKVAKFVHAPTIPNIPMPGGLQSGGGGNAAGGLSRAPGGRYARGGVLPGYTPGADVHHFVSPTGGRLDLSGGEAIMRPEVTAAVGSGWVNFMNRIARTKGVKGVREAMGFADGGIFGQVAYAGGGVLNPDARVYINGMAISRIAAAQVALAKKMWHIPIYMMQGGFGGNHIAASGTSHNYPGVGDFGPGSIGLEKALRRVGFAAWARNIPGRSSVGSGAHVHAVSLLDPGDRRSPQVYGSWAHHGNGLSGYGNDPAPHYAWIPGLVNHLKSIGIGDIAAILPGGGGGIASFLPGWLKDIFKAPTSWIKDKITSAASGITDKFGEFGGMLKDMVMGTAESVGSKVHDMITGWIPDLPSIGDVAGAVKGLFTHGNDSVVEAVRRVAATHGWGSGGQWNALSTLINHESTWNPTAQNPHSTAYGLFQLLDSTWAGTGIRKTDDPTKQAIAGLRYIKSRYGSPEGAWSFWSKHKWYSDGGVYGDESGPEGGTPSVPYNGTMMYDSGGYLPPGLTTVVNLTGKPEPVFTSEQLDKMGSDGGTIHYEPHFEGSDLTAEDVAGDLNFTFRRLRRGGRYAGVGAQ